MKSRMFPINHRKTKARYMKIGTMIHNHNGERIHIQFQVKYPSIFKKLRKRINTNRHENDGHLPMEIVIPLSLYIGECESTSFFIFFNRSHFPKEKVS